jgi:superfamily II DNA or RNA helicase
MTMPDTWAQPLPTRDLEEENRVLREENDRLRRTLATCNVSVPLVHPNNARLTPTAEALPPESKQERARRRIALFMSIFRGREDVYSRRWENSDGRAGYAPAALKDWNAINASKPEDRKKVAQQTRTFLPLTDKAIKNHLLGTETVGIYPLLPDESCWFLAVDFDKKSWWEDARAYLETCGAMRVPAALERSRSGKGGHIWIFFDQATPAITARKLRCAILTRTMERRHQLGLDSYDRFFPNQDTMPKGGFGNLIALPLQFAPRKHGNSVFIDADFIPYPDQWAYLSTIKRMPIAVAAEIVSEAQSKGDLIGVRMGLIDDEDGQDPWTLPPSRRKADRPIDGPFPEAVQIIRANLVYVEKKGLSPAMLNRILRLAAFQNPEFYKAQAMRPSTYDKPRVIACGQDFAQHVAVPRGCLNELLELLRNHNIRAEIRDERLEGTMIAAEFRGQLRPSQQEAVAKMLDQDDGILCAPTAFGKTTVAAWLIAKRKVNTLILVHRRQLLDQWQARLAMFLDMPSPSIGHIGGSKMRRTGCVDVAVIQSLRQKDAVNDLVAEYGQVIVDECHHLSAFTFEQVMRAVKARFIVGLTATPTRKDGHHPIIHMQCGPVRFSLNAKTMTEAAPFHHIVTPRLTDFQMPLQVADTTIQDTYRALVQDEERNGMIAADIEGAIREGRSPLLLTGRTDHLRYFAEKLNGIAEHIFVLKGGMGKKQRTMIDEAMKAVPEQASRLILATGNYIGEGFDDARLDTLFLALPISWKGTLQQYVGRLHRLHDRKQFVQVYDYVDVCVPKLARMYERRLKGYSAIGYQVSHVSSHSLPASEQFQEVRLPIGKKSMN